MHVAVVNVATPLSMLPNTCGNLFPHRSYYGKNHSPLLQAHTRTVVHRSRSCSFLQIAGEELAPDKVDELGLCAEHRNQGCCKAQGTRADVDQPGHPALVTAEPHLQQRKQGIAGKPASTKCIYCHNKKWGPRPLSNTPTSPPSQAQLCTCTDPTINHPQESQYLLSEVLKFSKKYPFSRYLVNEEAAVSWHTKCVDWDDTKLCWCYQASLLLCSNISGYFLTKLEISHSKI